MESNHPEPIGRRAFLRWSASATAAATLGQFRSFAQDTVTQLGAEEVAPAAGLSKEAPHIRVLAKEADNQPLATERMKTLHVRDLANDPLPVAMSVAEGRARIGLAAEPFQLSMRLRVPGFGEVFCQADNEGKGHTTPGNHEFVVEAAVTRLRRVREAAQAAK